MRNLYIDLHLYDIGYTHTCITVSVKQIAIARWGLSTVYWRFCYKSYLRKTGWDFYPFKLFCFNRCCYQILYDIYWLYWLNATVTINKLPNASHFYHYKKLCGRPPQYAPPLQVDLWPFDRESGVQVPCDVVYLGANLSLPRPFCSRLRPDVRDRQTDRQTDVRQHHRIMPPPTGGGGIKTVDHNLSL